MCPLLAIADVRDRALPPTPPRHRATALPSAQTPQSATGRANALAEQLRKQRESFTAMPVEQIVREYLSIEHRDDLAGGCPSAARLDEIGRSPDATKRAYTDGLLGVIDDIAERLAPDDPRSARVRTLSVFALMVGTLEVSRALADRQLADEVLERGVQTALALLGIAPTASRPTSR
jgi:TetR/AcrR family transcriptional regulator, transcriptional repressor for nem operon